METMKDLLVKRVGETDAGNIIGILKSAPGKISRFRMEAYLKERFPNYNLCGGETRMLMYEVGRTKIKPRGFTGY